MIKSGLTWRRNCRAHRGARGAWTENPIWRILPTGATMTRTIQQVDVTRRTFVQLAAATGALMCFGPAHAQSEPIVETTTGRVRGARSGDVSVFRGVPYAG